MKLQAPEVYVLSCTAYGTYESDEYVHGQLSIEQYEHFQLSTSDDTQPDGDQYDTSTIVEQDINARPVTSSLQLNTTRASHR